MSTTLPTLLPWAFVTVSNRHVLLVDTQWKLSKDYFNILLLRAFTGSIGATSAKSFVTTL